MSRSRKHSQTAVALRKAASSTMGEGDSPRFSAPPTLTHAAPLLYVVCTALVLRILAVVLLQHTNVWANAAEVANVAKSVAQGQGFSSPFGQPTGPTAWIAPVYPILLALIFKAFGVFSSTSATATLTFQITVSALTCIPIFKLGNQLGRLKVGLWAGWLWACYPYFVLLPALFIWDTTLSAFLISWLLLITVQLRNCARLPYWAFFGVMWAIAALTNTALLSVLPVCFAWLWWRGRLQGRSWMSQFIVSGIAFLLLVAPWCWRNWKTFDRLLPVRSSFGEALWLGNHPGGRGRHVYGDNAYENRHELERFQALGEITYARSRKDGAVAYIESDPLQFLRNVAYRIAYWWFGVGEYEPVFLLYAVLGLTSLAGVIVVFRAREADWYVVTASVLVFPLTYYLTDVMARYRHPIEPAMVLTSAYFLEWAAMKKSLNDNKLSADCDTQI